MHTHPLLTIAVAAARRQDREIEAARARRVAGLRPPAGAGLFCWRVAPAVLAAKMRHRGGPRLATAGFTGRELRPTS